MSGGITEIAAGGIFALLVLDKAIKLVTSAQAKRNGSASTPNGKLDAIHTNTLKTVLHVERIADTAEDQLKETRELNTILRNRPCMKDAP